MEKQAYNGNPVSTRVFRERYWKGNKVYPPIPLSLEDGESLTQQKIINNLIWLTTRHKNQIYANLTEHQRYTRRMTELTRKVRRMEIVMMILTGLLLVTMVTLGLTARTLL